VDHQPRKRPTSPSVDKGRVDFHESSTAATRRDLATYERNAADCSDQRLRRVDPATGRKGQFIDGGVAYVPVWETRSAEFAWGFCSMPCTSGGERVLRRWAARLPVDSTAPGDDAGQ